ncbi:hypothetical protein BGX26_005408 [Mortierella sp. AD094]|nr:hypothetical protein BGX26_005408 [Mortierella sp. AD094]
MEASEGTDDIFYGEPQLPSLIWSLVQELMDELSSSENDIQVSNCEALSLQESLPLRAVMEALAVHGMLLLSKIHSHQSQSSPVFEISDDDLALMVDYSLMLHDRQRGHSTAGEAERCDLTGLVMELMQIVVDHISQSGLMGSRADVSKMQRADLYRHFDLLLDALRDDFILKNNNVEVWSTLSKFHTILRTLVATNLPQAPPPAVNSGYLSDHSTSTSNKELLCKLGCHPGHIVMIKRLLQRWVIEASDFLQFHKAQASSQQSITKSTSHDGIEDQEEDGELDDETIPRLKNESLLEVDRICRSIADILAVIKLTTANCFEAHTLDRASSAFHACTLYRPFKDQYEDKWQEEPFWAAVEVFKVQVKEIGYEDPLERLKSYHGRESFEKIRDTLKAGPLACLREGWTSPYTGEKIDVLSVLEVIHHVRGAKYEVIYRKTEYVAIPCIVLVVDNEVRFAGSGTGFERHLDVASKELYPEKA